MPSCRYVATSPEDFWIEPGHSPSPPFESADGPLKLALIQLEEDSMVLRTRRRWISTVERREDDVPYPNQLDRLDEIGSQVTLEPVPVAVVYADRCPITG
jgi:hypothetical protein